MKKLIIALVLILCLGCNEVVEKPNVKPLSGYLIPTSQDWKDNYGDTPEIQLAYNAAVTRYDQRVIFNYIQRLHAADPNEADWREDIEARVEAVETMVKNGEIWSRRLNSIGTDEDCRTELEKREGYDECYHDENGFKTLIGALVDSSIE